jgi:chromosome segregation ATPase
MGTLSLSLLEIAVLLFGAIVLGATVYHFLSARLKVSQEEQQSEELNHLVEEWKHRYEHDMALREKEVVKLREQLREAEENVNIYSIEAEEQSSMKKQAQQQTELLRIQNQQLTTELELLRQNPLPAVNTSAPPDYLSQLQEAQAGLLEQNEKINRLLGNIDMIRETEEKQREILRNNEALSMEVEELKAELDNKDSEINSIRTREHLSREMTAMLDSAYSEFNILQDKLAHLEAQLSASRAAHVDHEDLQEAYRRSQHELEEHRTKLRVAQNDYQHLQEELQEMDAQLKEAQFQRQQLQKKVSSLEDLNKDLQVVADANKKLETQLRRIGELESMLNMVSEQRDQLIRRNG